MGALVLLPRVALPKSKDKDAKEKTLSSLIHGREGSTPQKLGKTVKVIKK